jgi:hypothetical protein
LAISKGLSNRRVEINENWNSAFRFEILLFELFKSFYCQITGVWLFTFLSKSNQIKL